MFQYANGFHISVKEDNSEVLLTFTQAHPEFSSSDNAEDVQRSIVVETISNVMMNGELAQELIDQLSKLVSKG